MRITNLPFFSSEPSCSSERLPKQHTGHPEKVRLIGWIVKNMKRKCLWRKKKRRQKRKKVRQQKKLKIVENLTSEERFPKPATEEKDSRNQFNGENYYGFENGSGRGNYSSVARGSAYVSESGEYSTVSLEELLNSRDYTSVNTESAYFSDSRDFSSSLEKLLKKEKVEVKGIGNFSSLTRSQSSKERKKVSFRRPEVSDIIILYSPAVEFKE